MSLIYRHGTNAAQGGLDITISLTPEEIAAIGPDASDLADWIDTALYALCLLRTGRNLRTDGHDATASDYYTVINDVDTRLLHRLEGIRDAAVRAQAKLGGSHGDLALAMDVSRSTAQSRRKAVLDKIPSGHEKWATKRREPSMPADPMELDEQLTDEWFDQNPEGAPEFPEGKHSGN